MRMLMWPTFSYPGNPSADSLYILARAVIRQRPDVHWYLPVPHYKTPVDDLDDAPWVTKIPMPFPTPNRRQEALTDPDLVWRFCPQEGTPVEAVISMSPQRTINLMNAWSIRTPARERPIVATWDLLARDDRAKEYVADEIELVQAAAGMAVSDLNLHEAPITEWMARYNARKYLSPALVRRVLETSRLYELGIDWDRLAKARSRKRERFTMYYGGRFAESKRFEELSEIIDECYRFGREMDFVICTGSISGFMERKMRERLPQVELHVGTNQDEAWAIQQTCHASICFSRGEIFGMAFWEQLGGGLATIMKTERWNESMLPDDYPRWARSRSEAEILIRMLYDQFRLSPEAYEQTYGWESEWPTYVRKRYDPRNLSDMVEEVKHEALARREVTIGSLFRGEGTILALAREVTENVDRIGWADLMVGVRQKARLGKRVVGIRFDYPRSNPTIDLYRAMVGDGWTDDVNEPEPTFVRTGERRVG